MIISRKLIQHTHIKQIRRVRSRERKKVCITLCYGYANKILKLRRIMAGPSRPSKRYRGNNMWRRLSGRGRIARTRDRDAREVASKGKLGINTGEVMFD